MPTYKLIKSGSPESRLRTNTIKFNNPNIIRDISDLSEPVHMYRAYPTQREPPPPTVAGEVDKKKKRLQKEKTKIYYNNSVDYQEARQQAGVIRMRERKPWILEDAHSTFIGNFQQQEMNHVLLVFKDNQFTVMPVDFSYKMNQKVAYRTLTSDEAEEQMKQSGVSMNRWIMHKLNGGENAQASLGSRNASATGNRTTQSRLVRGSVSQNSRGDMDENLFGGHFEDDEEYGQDVGEDAPDEADEILKLRQSRGYDEIQGDGSTSRSSKAVKQTSKLLRKMNQDFMDTDDDEERGDPYAALFGVSSDEEEEDDQNEPDEKDSKGSSGREKLSPLKKPDIPKTAISAPIPITKKASGILSSASSRSSTPQPHLVSVSPTLSIASSTTTSSSGAAGKLKKRTSTSIVKKNAPPILSPSKSERPAKKAKTSGSDSGDSSQPPVTEDEIIQMLRSAPDNRLPLKTIVERLGRRLKDKENSDTVKRVLKKYTTKSDDGFVALQHQ